jgi:hypothetical protein
MLSGGGGLYDLFGEPGGLPGPRLIPVSSVTEASNVDLILAKALKRHEAV